MTMAVDSTSHPDSLPLASRGRLQVTKTPTGAGRLERIQALLAPAAGNVTAAFTAAAPLAPVGALLMTVAVFGSPLPWSSPQWAAALDHPLFGGVINFLVAWFFLALLWLLLGLTTVERADSGSYSALCARLDQLRARQARLTARSQEPVAGPAGDAERLGVSPVSRGVGDSSIPGDEVSAHLNAVVTGLRRTGPEWILGTGYSTMWNRLHRAEEALLETAPAEVVIDEAQYDQLCLAGSKMGNEILLLTKLNGVLGALSRLLSGSPPQPPPEGDPPRPVLPTQDGVRGDPGPRSVEEARILARQVRRAINEFRDNRWAGIIQARNQLLATITFTGVAVYGLLWLSIMSGAEPYTIRAAMAFYMIGATVGLFNRLYSEAGGTSEGGDYHLGLTRLIGVPLLSGVAAVIGVVIVAMVAEAQLETAGQTSTLVETFDLIAKPLNVVTAAVFGFTPGLVVDRLKRQTERYQSELRSTRAPEGSA